MKKLLILAVLLMPVPALAQEASPDAFAYCAALAAASADHQLNIVKDEDAAKAMQLVADGYYAAATIKASETMNAPQAHVDKIFKARKAHYVTQLTSEVDIPAEKFESDVQACRSVEPQAYKVIEDFNKRNAADKAAE